MLIQPTLATTLRPAQTAQCDRAQTSGARNLVTGKARSSFRYMGAPAVPVHPSIGVRSNLKSGIVRGGRSYALRRNTRTQSMGRQIAAKFPRAYASPTPKGACKVRWVPEAHRIGHVYHFSFGVP